MATLTKLLPQCVFFLAAAGVASGFVVSVLQPMQLRRSTSRPAIHNGLIYTCGMVCEEGGESKDVTQQTKDALAELDRVLEKCGSDKHHILQMQAWVDDLSYVPEMNAVYDAWVSKEGPPGRACVQSKLIPPYKVEFKVTAVKFK